jgi:hypothetical protein
MSNKELKIKSSILDLSAKTVVQSNIKQAVYLTESTFAYDFLEFKYDKQLGKHEFKNIHHVGVKEYLATQGIYKRYIGKGKAILIRQEGCFIEEITPENAKDIFQKYVFSYTQSIEFEYNKEKYSIPVEAIQNTFLKQSNIFFNEKWLEHLEEHKAPILKDTKKYCYLIFKNAYVQISKKDKIESFPLTMLTEKCIWKSQRIEKDFRLNMNYENNPFVQFIQNVTSGIEGRAESLRSAFGYLIHNYFSPADGKAVFLYDEALTDKFKPMGGTGKGLCANALKLIRDTIKIDGKHWDASNRFRFELVQPSSQIVWIDETRPDFKFDSMFSCLTDGWTIERKHLPQFTIKPEDSPKVLICSNTIVTNVGSSFKRRQFIVELNDYYSKQIITGAEKPIEEEHGIMFSELWSQNTWDEFYSFMMDCVQLYLDKGLVTYELKNVNDNLLQQKTCSDFVEWCNCQNFQADTLYFTKTLFDNYKITYLDEDLKQRSFTNWLILYGNTHNLKYQAQNSNGETRFIFKQN